MRQTFITLDLETTGLNPEADDIIEVGMAKFRGKEVLDTFHSLVNSNTGIPYRIKLLTGIQQQELDSAPQWTAISGKLSEFIGDSIIIGQSIAFDSAFLAKNGLALANPTIDTLDLAGMLLPTLMDRSLKSLVAQFDLPERRFHRALNDAHSTREVFLEFCNLIINLPDEICQEIYQLCAAVSSPIRILIDDISPSGMRQKDGRLEASYIDNLIINNRKSHYSTNVRKGAVTEFQPLNIDLLINLLSASGPFARVFNPFEVRQGQVEMLSAIGKAINAGEHIIVEAGTGTGKSLAYLLPAAMLSLKTNTPFIISTNTINLQEQLLQKDIPAITTALGLENKLKVCQLKGRNNYLCLRRWNNLRYAPGLSADETKLIMRTLIWLCRTVNGDRAELNLSGMDSSLWSKINAQENNCLGSRCIHYQNSDCFLHFARNEAQTAHLLVVNHALLISDLVAGSDILPNSGYVVVDEAHHLEEETTRRLGFTYSQQDFLEPLQTLIHSRGNRLTGLLPELEFLQDKLSERALTASNRWQVLSQIISDVDTVKSRLMQFLNEVSKFIESEAPERIEYEKRLRINREKRSLPQWQRVMLSWENLDLIMMDMLKRMDEFISGITSVDSRENDKLSNLMIELAAVIHHLNELREKTNNLILTPAAGMVYWLTYNIESGAALAAAPLDVSKWLEQNIFSLKNCAILTGATLTMGGDFQYIKQQLGLAQAREQVFDSPFNYREAVLLLIPQDMPEPEHMNYRRELEESLLDICCATGGRTLILFTSHSVLRSAYKYLCKPLEDRGVLLLGQGIDGTPRQLISEFRSNRNIILMGTNSFWEGIDVVGEALSVLVITKLPFNVPTEPIYAARAEMVVNPFKELAVPQAVLKFKQGFGRLIRSSHDRGVVVVLDPRLITKYYGSVFLKSLPRCNIKKGVRRQLGSDILSALKNQKI